MGSGHMSLVTISLVEYQNIVGSRTGEATSFNYPVYTLKPLTTYLCREESSAAGHF